MTDKKEKEDCPVNTGVRAEIVEPVPSETALRLVGSEAQLDVFLETLDKHGVFALKFPRAAQTSVIKTSYNYVLVTSLGTWLWVTVEEQI